MQRIFTITGFITEPTLTQSILQANEQAKSHYLAQRLIYNGVGVKMVALDSSVGTIGNLFYLTFNVKIQIFAPLNENPNRALNLVNEIGYKNINLMITGDDVLNANGTITPYYNDQNASYKQDEVSLKDLFGGFATGAGLSTPVVIAAVLVLGVLYLKK
jgi:hypothetical protein